MVEKLIEKYDDHVLFLAEMKGKPDVVSLKHFKWLNREQFVVWEERKGLSKRVGKNK